MKNIIMSSFLLIAIFILGFSFRNDFTKVNINDQVNGFTPNPGFNVTITGCGGSTASVQCYVHGTTTLVSNCTNNSSNWCTVNMCDQPAGDYDLVGDNGGCTGRLDKIHWPGGCLSHLDEAITCSNCYGPGH